MDKQHDALIVSAHPDDAEMSMGGTMIRLADAGLSLFHLVLTAGQKGSFGDVATRKAEFTAAQKYLGAAGRILDQMDTELDHTLAIRKEVAKIIRELRPRIVFAPYHTNPAAERGGIAHRDHFVAGEIVRDAAKLARMRGASGDQEPHEVRRLYFFMTPKFSKPSLIVDVSQVMDRTFELIGCYKTQLAIQHGNVSIEEILRTKRAALGLEVGVRFAEPLLVDEPLHVEPLTLLSL